MTISSPDQTATIQFTTNGTVPSATNGSALANGGTVRISSDTTLRAVAIDPAGNVSQVGDWVFRITSPPPGAPTNGVSLLGSAVTLNATGTATLTGVVSPDQTILEGATVLLQSRRVPVSSARMLPTVGFTTEATTTTNANGGYTFRVRPQTTRQYRVVYQGEEGTFTSGIKLVRVRAVVGLNRTVKVVKRKRFMTVRGSFRPAIAGTRVAVRLDGPGRHARSLRAVVNRNGAWKVRFRAPKKTGVWKVKAVRSGTALYLGDASVTRSFRIRR